MSRRGSRFAQVWGRRLQRISQLLLEDLTAALFPASCLHCEVQLEDDRAPATDGPTQPCQEPPLPSMAQLWDGSVRRSLAGPWSLPLRLLCPSCAGRIQLETTPPHDLMHVAAPCVSAFAPSPELFRLIHAFKYDHVPELAAWLGAHLAHAAASAVGNAPAVIVPLPLHRSRMRQRGYNQAALLAQEVAAQLRAPVVDDVLVRARATPPLAQVQEDRRWALVSGAFEQSRPLPPAPTRIWLLDDVVTSGSTVRAATAALAATRGLDGRLAGVLTLCRGGANRRIPSR